MLYESTEYIYDRYFNFLLLITQPTPLNTKRRQVRQEDVLRRVVLRVLSVQRSVELKKEDILSSPGVGAELFAGGVEPSWENVVSIDFGVGFIEEVKLWSEPCVTEERMHVEQKSKSAQTRQVWQVPMVCPVRSDENVRFYMEKSVSRILKMNQQ